MNEVLLNLCLKGSKAFEFFFYLKTLQLLFGKKFAYEFQLK